MFQSHKKIWIIGCGLIAQEYASVLRSKNIGFDVIGRSERSALNFNKRHKIMPVTGGISKIINKNNFPEYAIVAVNINQLYNVCKELLMNGTKQILVEKPGGIDFREIKKLNNISNKFNANVYLAYNRRFFTSIIEAEKLILEDGGVKSIFFEFSEWSDEIKNLQIEDKIKKNWVLSNSSHVIDLVFYLCGRPKKWSYYNSGIIDWHQNAARFCGSGITEKNILFSYLTDWNSTGRWGIEIMTPKKRYILRPFEELKFIRRNSSKIENVRLNDSLDKEFKPGYYLQTEAFLDSDKTKLCNINFHTKNVEHYVEIAGYR